MHKRERENLLGHQEYAKSCSYSCVFFQEQSRESALSKKTPIMGPEVKGPQCLPPGEKSSPPLEASDTEKFLPRTLSLRNSITKSKASHSCCFLAQEPIWLPIGFVLDYGNCSFLSPTVLSEAGESLEDEWESIANLASACNSILEALSREGACESGRKSKRVGSACIWGCRRASVRVEEQAREDGTRVKGTWEEQKLLFCM